MAERLDVRRRLDLGRTLPIFQPAPAVPAPRQAEPETTPTRTRPAGRTDTRRPEMPNTSRPHRPVEPREDRAARLALARNSLTRRRALIAAHAPEPHPQNTSHQTRRPYPAEPPAQQTPLPPDINPNPRRHATPLGQRTLTVLPNVTPDPRKHVTITIQRTPTMPPDIPGTQERRPVYQAPRPWFAVAFDRDRSPDAPSSWRQHPHRQEVAA